MKLFKYFPNLLCSHYSWWIIKFEAERLRCCRLCQTFSLLVAVEIVGKLINFRLPAVRHLAMSSSQRLGRLTSSIPILANACFWCDMKTIEEAEFDLLKQSFPLVDATWKSFEGNTTFIEQLKTIEINFQIIWILLLLCAGSDCWIRAALGGRKEMGIIGLQLFPCMTRQHEIESKCRRYSVIYRCGAWDWKKVVVDDGGERKLRWYPRHFSLVLFICILENFSRLPFFHLQLIMWIILEKITKSQMLKRL